MKTVTYRAIISSRFCGAYFSVKFPDFNYENGEDIEYPYVHNPQHVLRKGLRDVISKWRATHDDLPEPTFAGNRYDIDNVVVDVTVRA